MPDNATLMRRAGLASLVASVVILAYGASNYSGHSRFASATIPVQGTIVELSKDGPPSAKVTYVPEGAEPITGTFAVTVEEHGLMRVGHRLPLVYREADPRDAERKGAGADAVRGVVAPIMAGVFALVAGVMLLLLGRRRGGGAADE